MDDDADASNLEYACAEVILALPSETKKATAAAKADGNNAAEPFVVDFSSIGLDPRLLRALAKKGYGSPTLVQAECIPRALEGKDVVAQARTGSGKTMAYLLPALHRILTGQKGRAGWQALILVPTRELCEQVNEIAAVPLCSA